MCIHASSVALLASSSKQGPPNFLKGIGWGAAGSDKNHLGPQLRALLRCGGQGVLARAAAGGLAKVPLAAGAPPSVAAGAMENVWWVCSCCCANFSTVELQVEAAPTSPFNSCRIGCISLQPPLLSVLFLGQRIALVVVVSRQASGLSFFGASDAPAATAIAAAHAFCCASLLALFLLSRAWGSTWWAAAEHSKVCSAFLTK